MKRLLISLSVAGMMMAAAHFAPAQTGPTGPGVPKSMPAPQTGAAMTPQRLVAFLRNKGHQADLRTQTNGAVTVVSQITQNNWRYVVEFDYTLDQQAMHVLCALGNSQPQFSAPQLMELLKKSYELDPMHFSYRPSDQRLCLEAGLCWTRNMTDAQLEAILNNLLQKVRETHRLWDPSQSPAPSPAAPAPGVPNSNIAAPKPAEAVSLANTIWTGTEDLPGFGKLEFKFLPNNQVIMVDAAGSSTGTYAHQGNTVVLTFNNGACVYTGTINGQTLAGSGVTAKATWNFSVQR